MKVSINWLNELVDLKVSIEELITLIPMRTIGLKDITADYIELDMKGYNRADLLSMRGVATEIAAITDSKVKFKEEEKFVWEDQKLSTTPVSIEDSTLANIQVVAKIENLKVEQSNDSWVKKLSSCGVRSIDSITDITNLIMLEFGQPLHSFNGATVKDDTINVRHAKEGEEIITLDGKTRKLSSTDIVLADTEKPLDVAGIMGGKDTEISPSTTSILLSASLFNPIMVRKTAQRLNLHSEASRRFQHGLTKKRLLRALDKAIRMYRELGGKLVAFTIVGDFEDPVIKVKLTQEKLNSLIGVDIKPQDVEGLLQKTGFSLASQGDSLGAWEVTIPYWRLDINIEEDLIEELVRLYGYEKIPANPLKGKLPARIDQSFFNTINDLRTNLVKSGLTEVQTYSFYSSDVLNNLEWNKENIIKIANPASSETEYLREDLWPNLLEVVAKNIKQGFKDITIFELGKVYSPQKEGLPNEPYRLSIALYNSSDNPVAELHQIFQNVIPAKTGIQLNKEGQGEYEKKYFHPKRMAFLEKSGKPIGGIAEIHKRFTDKFGIEGRVAVLELELDSFKNL